MLGRLAHDGNGEACGWGRMVMSARILSRKFRLWRNRRPETASDWWRGLAKDLLASTAEADEVLLLACLPQFTVMGEPSRLKRHSFSGSSSPIETVLIPRSRLTMRSRAMATSRR